MSYLKNYDLRKINDKLVLREINGLAIVTSYLLDRSRIDLKIGGSINIEVSTRDGCSKAAAEFLRQWQERMRNWAQKGLGDLLYLGNMEEDETREVVIATISPATLKFRPEYTPVGMTEVPVEFRG